jgi:hypothetical protein
MNQKATDYMDDSELYYTAFQEVEGGDRDDALWAKAITLADGDVDSAKYKYIKLRVDRLRSSYRNDDPSYWSYPADETATEVPEGYISVSEFAAKSALDKETIIQNIIEGVWDAQKIRNQWYILEPEDYPRAVVPEHGSLKSADEKANEISIKATRSLSSDDDIPDLELTASEESLPAEPAPGAVHERENADDQIEIHAGAAGKADDIELALEPLPQERQAATKKDIVARIASITARFTAVVAALLLITVVTNILREMKLSVEVELVFHGATAGILIFLLYYVWIKTRVTD